MVARIKGNNESPASDEGRRHQFDKHPSLPMGQTPEKNPKFFVLVGASPKREALKHTKKKTKIGRTYTTGPGKAGGQK